MKMADIVVSTYWSNKNLLDAIQRIPDQANCSSFSIVNQIILTTNYYCYRMEPDELISLSKSYDTTDKQKAQCKKSATVCSSIHAAPVAPLPAVVCSSTPADSESICSAGFQIHQLTPTLTEVCVDNMCWTTACK
ncbi:hypothetical protein Hanom_Chr12g01154881 [Helianthus anomalus]